MDSLSTVIVPNNTFIKKIQLPSTYWAHKGITGEHRSCLFTWGVMLEKQMKVGQSDKFGVCAWSDVSFGLRMDPCLWLSCAPFVAYHVYRLAGVLTCSCTTFDGCWWEHQPLTSLCFVRLNIFHFSTSSFFMLFRSFERWDLLLSSHFFFHPLWLSVSRGGGWGILMHLSDCRLLGTSMSH